MYAAMGLIFGTLFACVALIGGSLAPQNSGGAAFGAGFGVGAIVVFPVVYSVLGVVFGALSAERLVVQRLRGHGRRNRDRVGTASRFDRSVRGPGLAYCARTCTNNW